MSMEYNDFLNSPEWKAISAKRKEMDGYKCQCCGSKEHLVAHHTSYEKNSRKGNLDLSKLVTLCDRCHCIIHGKPVKGHQKNPLSSQEEIDLRFYDALEGAEETVLAYLGLIGKYGLFHEYRFHNRGTVPEAEDFSDEIRDEVLDFLLALDDEEFVRPYAFEKTYGFEFSSVPYIRRDLEKRFGLELWEEEPTNDRYTEDSFGKFGRKSDYKELQCPCPPNIKKTLFIETQKAVLLLRMANRKKYASKLFDRMARLNPGPRYQRIFNEWYDEERRFEADRETWEAMGTEQGEEKR